PDLVLVGATVVDRSVGRAKVRTPKLIAKKGTGPFLKSLQVRGAGAPRMLQPIFNGPVPFFYACSSFSTSSFFIESMACIAFCDFGDAGSASSRGSTAGTICHDTPKRSLSQPHCWAFSSPPLESRSQK